jgi:Transglutaminase-like superfamily
MLMAGRPIRLMRSVCREPDVVFLAVRMACWVVLISALARLCSIPRTFRLVTPVSRGVFRCEARLAPSRLAAVLDQILRTNVAAFTPTCWKRAAILYRYLRLAGHEPQILFGLPRTAVPRLTGHAWVELDGNPVCEATRPDCVVIYRFPC